MAPMFSEILMVLVGSAMGGVCRSAISQWSPQRGTMIVNCLGAFLIGLLVTSVFENRVGEHQYLAMFAGIGFLGGFTTVSTWALETWNLLKSRSYREACLYGLGTWFICLIAVAGGLALGRLF